MAAVALAAPYQREQKCLGNTATVERHLDAGDVARHAALVHVTSTAVLEYVLVSTHALLVSDSLRVAVCPVVRTALGHLRK